MLTPISPHRAVSNEMKGKIHDFSHGARRDTETNKTKGEKNKSISAVNFRLLFQNKWEKKCLKC